MTHNQMVKQAQKWQEMSIRYQTRAYDLSKDIKSPKDYPDEVFMCYRGYARCIQMCDAFWARIDAHNRQYFEARDREEKRKEFERLRADAQAEQDSRFIHIMLYLVAGLLGLLFGDRIIAFLEWLAPYIA